jgi:hypothetical protein
MVAFRPADQPEAPPDRAVRTAWNHLIPLDNATHHVTVFINAID